MKFSLLLPPLLLGGALASSPAWAEPMPCPDLADAVQVAACPTDAELQYTFLGFCGDNARLYGRDVLTCASFENYKAVKNTAMWESDNARFSGYLSCNLDTGFHPRLEGNAHARRTQERPDTPDLRLRQRPPPGPSDQGRVHRRGGRLQQRELPGGLRLIAPDAEAAGR